MAPSFHPVEAFMDAIPVDGRTVMREAIHAARIERRMQVRNFGARAKSLFECAKFGMDYALERDTSRRATKANAAWVASMDPLERERVALELEMSLLRNKVLGKRGFERDRIYQRMAAYSKRLAEIAAAQSKREAA